MHTIAIINAKGDSGKPRSPCTLRLRTYSRGATLPWSTSIRN